MSEKWKSAAAAYRAANEQSQRHELASRKDEEERLRCQQDISAAGLQLQAFLAGEGAAALELLRESGRHIVFGEENEGGGRVAVYFLNGDGLQLSVEATGLATAYASEKPKPKLLPISSQQAVEAAVLHCDMKPLEVVDWLRGQLDGIACQAPQVAS